jgi:hypothetical protein
VTIGLTFVGARYEAWSCLGLLSSKPVAEVYVGADKGKLRCSPATKGNVHVKPLEKY